MSKKKRVNQSALLFTSASIALEFNREEIERAFIAAFDRSEQDKWSLTEVCEGLGISKTGKLRYYVNEGVVAPIQDKDKPAGGKDYFDEAGVKMFLICVAYREIIGGKVDVLAGMQDAI